MNKLIKEIAEKSKNTQHAHSRKEIQNFTGMAKVVTSIDE